MDVPRWVELASAIGLGSIAKPLFNFLTFRERKKGDIIASLWVEIGKLQQQNKEQEKKMDVMSANFDREVEIIRTQKHEAQNAAQLLQMENLILKMEVNDELKRQGLPPRYDLHDTKPAMGIIPERIPH